MHQRVLIANRGEIAIRIAKAATALGLESVGVYAPADVLTLHTRYTTEAHEIGSDASDAVGPYLDGETLVRLAKATNCDCVHPGYGFLSEDASFAERCESEGLAFVGPSAAALRLFGNKIRARQLAASLDIPVVPGQEVPPETAAEAAAAAERHASPPNDSMPRLRASLGVVRIPLASTT